MSKTRETVSYEAVAKVMEALTAAGEKTTVRRVEAEVGGGSHTTLLGHIKRWKDERRAAMAAGPAAGIITNEVSAALVAWTQSREEAARDEANARVGEIDELYRAAKDGWEKADTRIEELEAELEKARATAVEREQTLTKEAAALQTRIEGADKQLAELKEQLQREQQSSEASRLAAAEARIKADAAQESIKTLGRANEELLAETREQGKALAEAQQRAAVAEERAKSREEQLREAREAAAEERRKADAAQQAAKEMSEAKDALRTEAAKSAQVLAEAAKRAAVAEEHAKSRDEQLADARAAGSKAAQAAEELQKSLSETERRLSVAERELAICREQHRGGSGGGGKGGSGGGEQGGGSDSKGSGPEPDNKQRGRSARDVGSQANAGALASPADEEVNVTMRQLGKPATEQEISRSMDALLTCAPKLGHELHRGQAPKTRPRAGV